jgi:hypothetical protein
MEENNSRTLVDKAEEDRITRTIMAWVNTFPNMPVPIINYEQLAADKPSMALSLIQGTYITSRYILGGHRAEYPFKLIYRIKSGGSNNSRLLSDELLDEFGAWAAENPPELGTGIKVRKMEPTTRSALFAAYEDGDEDHQILMKMTYEVI